MVPLLLMAVPVLAAGTAPSIAQDRGAYLAKVGDCVGCHTDSAANAVPYAGGRALATPFGTFYGPNITPDPQAGLGRWTEADFMRAMRSGVRPDGAPYYPAFPYPSFTQISDEDLRDLWAYLRTLPPSSRPSRAHELRWPYSWRFTLWPWRWVYFRAGPSRGDPPASPVVARGAYLVGALGHCGECHTPRNFLGGPEAGRFLAGGVAPDGKKVPGLRPRRLGKWTDEELADFLTTGLLPNGDVTNETMGEVVRNSTSQLTRDDLAALIAYLRALPAD